MEFITLTDVAICVLAVIIPVLTVIDRINTRQGEKTQADLTKKISNVQDDLVELNKKMDGFIRANAEVEKNYKADRRKEAKTLFMSSIDEIFNRLDRLSVFGYYRIRENRILAQEHFNWAQYETIKLKSNIYVTENKRLYVLVDELEAMFNLYGPHINTYEHEDNGLGGLGDQVGPIRNKFRKVLMEVRGNDDL